MKLSQIVDVNFFSFEKSQLGAVSIQSVEMLIVQSECLKINFISFRN